MKYEGDKRASEDENSFRGFLRLWVCLLEFLLALLRLFIGFEGFLLVFSGRFR